MTPFKLKQTGPGEMTLFVNSDLHGEPGKRFSEWMEKLYATKCLAIVVDLSQGIGITSEGIGKLLSVRRRALEDNRTFKINGCSDNVYSTFKKIRLHTLIEIAR